MSGSNDNDMATDRAVTTRTTTPLVALPTSSTRAVVILALGLRVHARGSVDRVGDRNRQLRRTRDPC